MPQSSVAALTDLGRRRLSHNFFMREMLYSEVGNAHGVPNIPEDPELAVEAGSRLASNVLEPLLATFGHIAIRSAYRSPTLNAFCHDRYRAGDEASWCDCNETAAAHHIWDHRDADGYLGATATVVVPSYIEHYELTRDYRPLAWKIRDTVPNYADILFFEHLCAFNIRWFEGASERSIRSAHTARRETLTSVWADNFEGSHAHLYDHVLWTR